MPNRHPESEFDLLLKLKTGDERAFQTLYECYDRKIYYNLLKIIHLPEVVAELHQDVFIKIWHHRDNIDVQQSFESYLTTIARHVAIDFYRKAARDRQLKDQLEKLMTQVHDPIVDHINFMETNASLMAAIDKLPPQRKLVFTKIKLENESYENAAKHFGVSVGTIKDHMAKAMVFVRNEMKDSHSAILPILIIQTLIEEIQKQG